MDLYKFGWDRAKEQQDLENAIEHIHECPECNGVGTQRVEELNPVDGSYNDYDIECPTCEGTGELENN